MSGAIELNAELERQVVAAERLGLPEPRSRSRFLDEDKWEEQIAAAFRDGFEASEDQQRGQLFTMPPP